MAAVDRDRLLQAAGEILRRGDWCVLEVCTDIPGQRWERRLVACCEDLEAIADWVELELAFEPCRDARLVGCDRLTLLPHPETGAHLCQLAPEPAPPLASW